MAKARTPMLFAPPLPPLLVPKVRRLLIGRSPEADLVIASRRVSREHAEVRHEGDHVVIEDLGSTNGTLVNGEKIAGPRVLRLGDTIDIGGRSINYCLVEEPAPSPLSSEDTFAFDPEALKQELLEALRGDLSQLPLSSVLQLLESNKQSGAISIVTRAGTSMLWLENGRPVHAETPELSGRAAALTICRYEEGRFIFEGGHPVARRTIDMSVTEVLLEASRIHDEAGARAGEKGGSGQKTRPDDLIEWLHGRAEEAEQTEPPLDPDAEDRPEPESGTGEFKDWWKDD